MFKDLYAYLYHTAPEGGIPLKGTGIVLGLALLAAHLWVLKNGPQTKAFLKGFPRNYACGAALLTVDFIWAMLLLTQMDMGEFFGLRKWFIFALPIGFVGMLLYVKEFLAVRALGALALLAAGPVLTAAYLQPPVERLLLPILAYVWILAGLFMVGMPFLLRDWIAWITAREARWNVAVWGGIGYGALMLILAITTY